MWATCNEIKHPSRDKEIGVSCVELRSTKHGKSLTLVPLVNEQNERFDSKLTQTKEILITGLSCINESRGLKSM
jgi:hypothetical protein